MFNCFKTDKTDSGILIGGIVGVFLAGVVIGCALAEVNKKTRVVRHYTFKDCDFHGDEDFLNDERLENLTESDDKEPDIEEETEGYIISDDDLVDEECDEE